MEYRDLPNGDAVCQRAGALVVDGGALAEDARFPTGTGIPAAAAMTQARVRVDARAGAERLFIRTRTFSVGARVPTGAGVPAFSAMVHVVLEIDAQVIAADRLWIGALTVTALAALPGRASIVTAPTMKGAGLRVDASLVALSQVATARIGYTSS